MNYAGAAQKPLKYTVKEGDTLWTISEHFYGSPFYWYFIWEANRDKAKNPHWIFPGQELLIPPKEEVIAKTKGKLIIEKEAAKPVFHWEKQVFVPYITKRLPQVYGYVSSEVFDPEKTLYSRGDFLNLNLTDQAVQPGDFLLVYKVVEDGFEHPFDGRYLGKFVKNVAVVKVIKIKGNKALAKVMVNDESVMEGYRLTKFEMPDPIMKLNYKVPAVAGKIIALEEERVSANIGDLVIVDIGKDRGISPGDVLFAYVKPWDNKVGKLVVLKVNEDTSTCYVLREARTLEVGVDVASNAYLEMQ